MTAPVQALRWLCVLPGAFVAAVLAMFPIHWVVMLIHYFGGSGDSFITIDGKNLFASIPPETIEHFGYALFVPFTLIVAGARLAPRFKFVTGITLAVLLALALAIAFAAMNAQGSQVADGQLRLAVTCILWIIGVGCALFQAYQFDRNMVY
jgi:hypothetical protein